MKVVFFGTPDFAVEALKKINESHEVLKVVTKPDAKKKRGHKMSPSAVKRYALSVGLDVLTPTNLDSEFIESLKALSADIFVVVAYGKILSEALINASKYGAINIHASLLPKYRGASPLQSALLNGDAKSGVTIMQIVKALDAGDILLKREIDISGYNLVRLHDDLALLGAESVIQVLYNIDYYMENKTKQDDSKATYCTKINKEDGLIDWDESAESIYNKVRAFTPILNVYTFFKGERFIVTDSSFRDSALNESPGTIIGVNEASIDVACKKGVLSIKKLKVPGKREMTVKDYLKGNKIEKDMILGG